GRVEAGGRERTPPVRRPSRPPAAAAEIWPSPQADPGFRNMAKRVIGPRVRLSRAADLLPTRERVGRPTPSVGHVFASSSAPAQQQVRGDAEVPAAATSDAGLRPGPPPRPTARG